MTPKNPFYYATKHVPNTISFALILIRSRGTHLGNLAKRVFERVLYGLTVTSSVLQVVLSSLSIIATYQILWEQINSQGIIKNGGLAVLNKHSYSIIPCNAIRKHHLFSQFGG